MDKFELLYNPTETFNPKTAFWDLLWDLGDFLSNLYRAGLLIWFFAGTWCIMHILPIEFNLLVLFNFFSLAVLDYDLFLRNIVTTFVFFFWLICAVELNYCLIMLSIYYYHAGVLTFLV